MKNRTYLTKANIGTIVKGTLLATALVTSTLTAGCKDNDTETTDAEVVAEVDASAEKGSAVAEKNGKASGTTATGNATNAGTATDAASTDNAGATTEATRTSTDRQAASTESTSKATGTTASSRGNNSTTETSRANATTEATRPASTTETSKPNSTTEAPKPGNSTTETSKPNSTTEAPAHTHTWVENTEAVYVPEVGHYEEVMVDPGGEVPHYVEHTLCAHCGYDYTIDPDNCGLSHTCPDGTYSSYGSQMVQDGYITIPPYYEKRWIVDTPAHTEQQGNGTYKCSTCGAEK